MPSVFPAHAGMSRRLRSLKIPYQCFPRSRGDEPIDILPILPGHGFSPLTRG